MLIHLLAFTILVVVLHSSEAQIPYSYASGRDVAAVERRFKEFNAAKARGASSSEIDGICGAVSTSTFCSSIVGRPSDAQTNNCDSICCQLGYKTGNCGTSFNGNSVESISIAQIPSLANVENLSRLTGECRCSNDSIDNKCGPDGSFLGIRCPFDNSACWRKCCREGREGGKCGGFLRTRCRCY